MLTLEKRSANIGITLRQQDPFLSRCLLKAFAVAIVIHLCAAFLFQVNLFKILGSQAVFAPILVDADIRLPQESQVITQIEREGLLPHQIKEPKSSTLVLPAFSVNETIKPDLIVGASPSQNDFFAVINQDIYPLDFMILKKEKRIKKPVQVHISGPLAEKDLLSDGVHDLEISSPCIPCRVAYAVWMDNRTGTIFWHESKEQEGSLQVQKEAEKILHSLRFQRNEHSFVTTGEVEIHFGSG